MEAVYEQRDTLVEEITEWVHQSRDVLTGLYRQEMRKLGDFGFIVDGSPRTSTRTAATTEPVA